MLLNVKTVNSIVTNILVLVIWYRQYFLPSIVIGIDHVFPSIVNMPV